MSQRAQNKDRLRRAYSWLHRSEEAETDDERFIFLWIAFNAGYGVELAKDGDDATESKRFRDFLGEILERDREGVIGRLLWKTFPGPIRVLLENRYVFGPFWECVRGAATEWHPRFRASNRRARKALAKNDVHGVLVEVFLRLYVLRNQIFHGGATFGEGLGRDQLRDGATIMASLVPAILEIMDKDITENPNSEVWGKILFPRIDAA